MMLYVQEAAESMLASMAEGGESSDSGDEGDKTGGGSGGDVDDIYWRHRRQAVRLGRRLRKVQKRAVAARDGGDYSQVRRQ
jgi:hypothetical protein